MNSSWTITNSKGKLLKKDSILSTDGTEDNPYDLEYFQKEKQRYTLMWCYMFTAPFIIWEIAYLILFFRGYNLYVQILVILQPILTTIHLILMKKFKPDPEKHYFIVLSMELMIIVKIIFLSLDFEDYQVEEVETLINEYFGAMKTIHIVVIMAFFFNSFILLEQIEKTTQRKIFLVAFSVATAVVEVTVMVDLDFPFESIIFELAMKSMVMSTMIGTHVLFAICIHYLLSIKSAILSLEIDQNKKYKYMFDYIQDAVLLVQGSELKFANTFAYELCDYAQDDDESELAYSPLHERQFLYLFQFHSNGDQNGNDGEAKKVKQTIEGKLSLRDML